MVFLFYFDLIKEKILGSKEVFAFKKLACSGRKFGGEKAQETEMHMSDVHQVYFTRL